MKNPSIAKLAKEAGSPMQLDIKKIVPQPKKKKLSYDEAYLRRDLNLYGKLSKDEFIAEAKRQKAGGAVPTKPMETKVKTKTKTEPTIKAPDTSKKRLVEDKKSKLAVDGKSKTKPKRRRKRYNPRLNRFE